MLIETQSTPLNKALAVTSNSVAPGFSTSINPVNVEPGGDGVWAAGDGGEYAPNRLFLLPYCDGSAGSNFSVRVYGWQVLGEPSGAAYQIVWIPFLLAELFCTACNQPGPAATAPGVATTLLLDSERLCDTISLTQGALGLKGYINSTGPGSDLVAFTLIELAGCRLFSFDFQQTDPVGMNCLWSRA